MPSSTPRGVTTSEFWMFVAGIALALAHAIASALGVKFSPGVDAQLNIASALPIVYGALRTWLKIHIPVVGNDLPDLTDDTPPAPSAPSLGNATPQPPLDQSLSLATIAPAGTVTATVKESPFLVADAPAAAA